MPFWRESIFRTSTTSISRRSKERGFDTEDRLSGDAAGDGAGDFTGVGTEREDGGNIAKEGLEAGDRAGAVESATTVGDVDARTGPGVRAVGAEMRAVAAFVEVVEDRVTGTSASL